MKRFVGALVLAGLLLLPAIGAFGASDLWRIRFSAQIPGNPGISANTFTVGVSAWALDGKDGFDVNLPPLLPPAVILSERWAGRSQVTSDFITDIRVPWSAGTKIWAPISLSYAASSGQSVSGDSVILSWSRGTGSQAPPAGSYLLTNLADGTTSSLDSDGSLTLPLPDPSESGTLAVFEIAVTYPDGPVISDLTAAASAANCVITWKTDLPTDTRAEYWNSSRGTGWLAPSQPGLATDHRVTLTGLTPGAIYHYRVKGYDSLGRIATSSEQTFRTDSSVATPVFSPHGEAYALPQAVTITCSEIGAAIHYTVNGDEPTLSDPVIASGASLLISYDTALKAKAWVNGDAPSATVSETYLIGDTIDVPILDPPGGTYDWQLIVTASCPTPGAVLHYTTNGIDPTESDPVLSGPVAVTRSQTLKVVGYRAGFLPSPVASAVYMIEHAVVHVAPTGSDANDGSSWSLAKRTVQAGLDAAAAGDDVWVAAGSYVECIALKDGVGLYGGFAGTEMTRDSRNVSANLTVLDGHRAGSVVTIREEAESATKIDGFTVTNGTGTVVGGSTEGGAVFCGHESSATISNNTFTANSASFGAGIFCDSRSAPAITGNRFFSNSAGSRGGAIYLAGSRSAIVASNLLVGNSAGALGGGIACEASSPRITNNDLVRNTAPDGGAISVTGVAGGSLPTARNNIVFGNSSGVFVGEGVGLTAGSNCLFGNVDYDYRGISAGSGDLTADPIFVDSANGDFHLQTASPCFDAGDDSAVHSNASDIDGQGRIQGAHVEIGADELPATAYFTTGGYIKAGRWNLVSLPADPVCPDPLRVFAGIDVPNSSFQFWRNDVEGGGFQNYGDTFGWTGPVVRGVPYWLLTSASGPDHDLRYSGVSATADFQITFPARSAAPYWVMFGTPSPNPISADAVQFKNVTRRGDVWLNWVDAFSQEDATLRIVDSNAQGWQNDQSRFTGITPSPWMGEHEFEPWWGYWLLVHDEGELTVKF